RRDIHDHVRSISHARRLAVGGCPDPVAQSLAEDRTDQVLDLLARRCFRRQDAHHYPPTPASRATPSDRASSALAPLLRPSTTGAMWIANPASSNIARCSVPRPESTTMEWTSSSPHSRASASRPNFVWSATIITSWPHDIIWRSVSTRRRLEL